VSIDITDAQPPETVLFDEIQNRVVCRDRYPGETAQARQDQIASIEATPCDFADRERMNEYSPAIEQLRSRLIPAPEVIHSNRRVGENHTLPVRRRALSRSIEAFRASRTSDDFSRNPVKDWA
jgi:hypothetical protein